MPDRFDKFTEPARRALRHAHEEAERFNHNYIAPEHILLGLMRDEDGVAARVLDQLNVEPHKVRSAVEFFLGKGNHRARLEPRRRVRSPFGLFLAGRGHRAMDEIELTPRAKRVLELAVDEARDLGHDYVGAEHLLLGLLREGESEAARLLNDLGVSLEKPRAQVIQGLGRDAGEQAGPEQTSRETSSDVEWSSSRSEGFTYRARKVLQLAQEEARRFKHDFVGTEHLLLGLIREEDGVAGIVLSRLGVKLDSVRSAVEHTVGRGEHSVPGEIGLTPQAKRVIESAVDEARRLNHHYIGTEHLLLGLVREDEGIAAGALETLGVRMETIRERVIEVLKSTQSHAGQPAESGTPLPPEGQTIEDEEPDADALARLDEELEVGHPEDLERDIDRALNMEGISSDDPVYLYLREIARTAFLKPPDDRVLAERMSQGREALEELETFEGQVAQAEAAGDAPSPEHNEARRRLHTLIQEGVQAKEQLVQANLRLVVSIARRYTGRGLSLLDLIQEGNIGLMKAADKFDHARGFKFSTYATWWIRQAITRAISDQSRTIRLPVHVTEMVTRLRRAAHELQQQLLREPTEEELGQELNMSAERVRKILDMARHPASLDAPMEEGEDSFLGDFIEDERTATPMEEASRQMTREQADDILLKLTERERQILQMRYGLTDDRPRTLEEVARAFGITRERIRRIETRILRKLSFRYARYGAAKLRGYLAGPSEGKMTDRFDKFTERARKVLQLAQEEAQRFNHNYIGTEHILLGLVREGDGVAARVLNNLGIELHDVRSTVEFIIGRGPRMSQEIGLTPLAKRVIELAVDEARRLNHHYIGTEHLLLGLVREGGGIAAGVLESLGVSLEKVRAQVIEVLKSSSGYSYSPPRYTSSPPEPPVSIVSLVDAAYEVMGLDASDFFAAGGTAERQRDKADTGDAAPDAEELARIEEMVRVDNQAGFEEQIDRALKAEGVEFDDPVRVYLQHIARASPLEPSEEGTLVEAIAQGRTAAAEMAAIEKQAAGQDSDDQKTSLLERIIRASEARERLVQANLRRLLSIALRYTGTGLSLLDLMQEGTIALAKAADSFDPGRGYSFSSYAVWSIDRAIAKAVRDMRRTARLPAHVVEMLVRLREATHKVLRQTLREPTLGELARELGMPPERVRTMLDFARALKSLDAQIDYARFGPTEFGAVVPPEEQAERLAVIEQVKAILPELPEDDRYIVTMFYGLTDGHMRTIAEIAKDLGVSRGLVRQVMARLHRKLNP